MAIFGRGYNVTFDGGDAVKDVSDEVKTERPVTKSDDKQCSTLKIWVIAGLIIGGFIMSGNIKREHAADNAAAYNGAASVARIISDAE